MSGDGTKARNEKLHYIIKYKLLNISKLFSVSGLTPNVPCCYYLLKGLRCTHINSVAVKHDKQLLKTLLQYVLQIHSPETQQNLGVKWNMDRLVPEREIGTQKQKTRCIHSFF